MEQNFEKKTSQPFNLPEGCKVNGCTIILSQDNDSNDEDELGQDLTVVSDSGSGRYLILKTTRWALDPEDIDKLADTLKQILKLGGDA